MFDPSAIRAALDEFEKQFEIYGDEFIYREHARGPAIKLSGSTHDEFVRIFLKRYRLLFWGSISVIIISTLTIIRFVEFDNSQLVFFVIIFFSGMFVLWIFAHRWIMSAPARVLGSQLKVSDALSREEVKERHLAQLSYHQLALVAGGGAVVLWGKTGTTDSWEPVWLFLGVSLILIAMVQAIRKWQFGRKR